MNTPKVALVTGASRGIGRAIAKRLAADGMKVAVNYANARSHADSAVREIEAAGGNAMAVQADIKSRDQVVAMFAAVQKEFGDVDVLVNNAGVVARGDLEDFDFATMGPMRETNVDGTVYCTRSAYPAMKAKHWGRIINITSIAAHGSTAIGTTFYAATKAAVIALTRRFAWTLGPHGITVNAVAPGFVVTDMLKDSFGGGDFEKVRQTMADRAMMRRLGEPEDIAHTVSFIASEQSGFMTAQTITVDGGRMDYIGHA
ncbi:MAG: 3-oxoacyl-ACP reductase family protein [Bryobacteraceae bacterium]